MKKSNPLSTKILVVVTFAAMLTANALANILPINGKSTGEVSDSYANLFAPAGVTFSIWGLIYLLLGAYTIFQLDFYKVRERSESGELLGKIGLVFAISSIANTGWIFAWHYDMILLSMGLMIIILFSLIWINREIRKVSLTDKEYLFIRLPFSIYFGWITVATIANATVYLVSIGWNGFGLDPVWWTVIILIVGILIGILTMFSNKDMPYGFVLIWAYVGIFIKHTSEAGFNGQYQAVINTVLACLALLLAAEAYVFFSRKDQLLKRMKNN